MSESGDKVKMSSPLRSETEAEWRRLQEDVGREELTLESELRMMLQYAEMLGPRRKWLLAFYVGLTTTLALVASVGRLPYRDILLPASILFTLIVAVIGPFAGRSVLSEAMEFEKAREAYRYVRTMLESGAEEVSEQDLQQYKNDIEDANQIIRRIRGSSVALAGPRLLDKFERWRERRRKKDSE